MYDIYLRAFSSNNNKIKNDENYFVKSRRDYEQQ